MTDQQRRTRIAAEPLRIETPEVAADSGSPDSRISDPSADQVSPITVRGVLERLSLVIAPSTLVIALAFWFGWDAD